VVTVRATGPDRFTPVRCRRCGHATQRGRLTDARYLKRSVTGVRHLAAEDCCPDEYVLVCPDCGEVEPFDEAILCAECLEYPCACALGSPIS